MKFPRLLALAAALSIAAGGAFVWLRRPELPLSVELATPSLALAQLGAPASSSASPSSIGRLFYTRSAAAFLPAPAEAAAREKQVVEYETVLHDPKAWRALDRRERFEALLLTGSPAEFRPLLDHLRQAPDWKLTYVDATSFIFRRTPAVEWTPAALGTLKECFATHSRSEQVTMRVQTAHRLAAIGEYRPAKELLDEAEALDVRSTAVWTELASWHAAQGKWDESLEASEKAVKYGRNYPPALAAKANALFAHGKFNDALHLTRRLVEKAPEDGPTLYLHAKVTHAARAYAEEIETLQKIIAGAEARHMPTGTWRIFLAQAYGATGEAEPALEQFEKALKDPGLTERERSFAEKGIERIRSREPIL